VILRRPKLKFKRGEKLEKLLGKRKPTRKTKPKSKQMLKPTEGREKIRNFKNNRGRSVRRENASWMQMMP
jgi:hypothetical protein